MTYGIAMRHLLALVICVALVWLAVEAFPYWVNAVIAGAMLTKPPTPPSAAESATASCHINQSAVALFAPLIVAWLVRLVSLRGLVQWMRIFRASIEMVLVVVAVYFVFIYAVYPRPHPLTPLFVERCGPVRFLMK